MIFSLVIRCTCDRFKCRWQNEWNPENSQDQTIKTYAKAGCVCVRFYNTHAYKQQEASLPTRVCVRARKIFDFECVRIAIDVSVNLFVDHGNLYALFTYINMTNHTNTYKCIQTDNYRKRILVVVAFFSLALFLSARLSPYNNLLIIKLTIWFATQNSR